jgi:hypothetical protein
MIGIFAPHAQNFVLVLAVVTTLAFAIPILFAPLRWAKLMLWKIPEQPDLVVYFGRCLGAFVLIFEAFLFRAGINGVGLTFVFEFMILVWIFMVVIHVVGAIQKIQPITETLEIGFWLILILLTVGFWPTAHQR